VVQKPNFGLSGALAKDSITGNVKNGIVLKWCEPPEARKPTKRWRLYIFKNDTNIGTMLTQCQVLFHEAKIFL
jgi:smad nuclear-interacting protein 1